MDQRDPIGEATTPGAAAAGDGAGPRGRGAHSRAASRREARKARTSGQRWRRRLLGAFAAVLVAVPAAAGASWWYVNYKLDQAHRVAIGKGILKQSKPGAPFNVLLIGSDSRSFVKGSQSNRFGSGSVVTGQRSDVIIIARVVPATKRIYMLSIPRDTWVNIPGHVPYISGMNRINAAFNNGPGLLIRTLRADFGIPIEHFAEVNFSGFQSMVQAVGGIRIDFPYPVEDSYTGLSIQHTGCQLISGGNALAFVRSRHLYYKQNGVWQPDYGSDWSRIRRQDVFFHALLDQVKAKQLDLPAMTSLLSAVVKNLTIDSTWSNTDLIRLAWDFRHASTGAIHTEVLPTVPDVLPSGADVLLEAQPYDRQMVAKFLAIGEPHHAAATTTTTTTSPGGSTSSTSSTSTSTTTTTTTSPPSSVVFDTQAEPWNGTPC
jgi:LCP family protein required for cell wall assembly